MNKNLRAAQEAINALLEDARIDQEMAQQNYREADKEKQMMWARKNNIVQMSNKSCAETATLPGQTKKSSKKVKILSPEEITRLTAEAAELDVKVDALVAESRSLYYLSKEAERVTDVLSKAAMFLLAPEAMYINLKERFGPPEPCEPCEPYGY